MRMGLHVSADHPTHWLGLHIRERLLTIVELLCVHCDGNNFVSIIILTVKIVLLAICSYMCLARCTD